jgi:Bax protein
MYQRLDVLPRFRRRTRPLLWCSPLLFWLTTSYATPVHAPSRGPAQLVRLAYEAPSDVPRIEARDLPPALFDRKVDEERKKALFVEVLLPLVLLENEAVAEQRDRMLPLLHGLEQGRPVHERDRHWLLGLAVRYRIAGDPLSDPTARRELRAKVDIVPVELALAQAAIESGWGRSRAARVDHDLFGMKAKPGRESRHARASAGKVKRAPRFATLREAVQGYVLTLNSHNAYHRFRQLRAALRARNRPLDGERLAQGLEKYSTRGRDYVRTVQAAIRRNNFERFNLAALDSFWLDETRASKEQG